MMHYIPENALNGVCVHHVGNKVKEGKIILSDTELEIDNDINKRLLSDYLLKAFRETEVYYNFYNVNDLALNDVYSIISEVFDKPKSLHKNSKKLAKFLYEKTMHPQIKEGELYVTSLAGCEFNNQPVDVIGIFKSETKERYISISEKGFKFTINNFEGIDTRKLDKGCLIFNVDREEGFKICIIDNTNKTADTQYWVDNFLGIKPCLDSYHFTKDFLGLTKTYVIQQMSNDFEISKVDQADYLNKSVEYFKNHEYFDEAEFSRAVFEHKEVINSFNDFKKNYVEENSIEVENGFFISEQALRKQARSFKSVLKLDKNFHIYIHGNRNLIEQGVEKDGRKYYKIYFDQEF